MAALSSIIIAGVGLAVAGFGQYKSMQAQKKAQKEAKNQARAQNRRARRQTIREAAIRRGQIENAGAVVGGGVGSSAISAGTGSVSSQAGTELGFNLGMERSQFAEARAKGKAQTWGAIAGIGGSIFSFGAEGGISSMTGENQPKPTQVPTPALQYGGGGGGAAGGGFSGGYAASRGLG